MVKTTITKQRSSRDCRLHQTKHAFEPDTAQRAQLAPTRLTESSLDGSILSWKGGKREKGRTKRVPIFAGPHNFKRCVCCFGLGGGGGESRGKITAGANLNLKKQSILCLHEMQQE